MQTGQKSNRTCERLGRHRIGIACDECLRQRPFEPRELSNLGIVRINDVEGGSEIGWVSVKGPAAWRDTLDVRDDPRLETFLAKRGMERTVTFYLKGEERSR